VTARLIAELGAARHLPRRRRYGVSPPGRAQETRSEPGSALSRVPSVAFGHALTCKLDRREPGFLEMPVEGENGIHLLLPGGDE
jgi:hypothetical protein